MKRFLIWAIFLFCVYKTLDTYVLNGRLFRWVTKRASRHSLGAQTLKQHLAEEAKEYGNPQSIHLTSGRIIEGKVIREEANSMTIRQNFGHTGYLDETFPLSEIQDIVSHEEGDSGITDEEVAIKQEFPQFHVVKRQHHTFFTDSDYFFIERIVSLLERLYDDFSREFGTVSKDKTPERAYVLIFGNEKNYREYARTLSPALGNSSGFYTFEGRRLALYNQFQSGLFGDWEKEVTTARKEIHEKREELERLRGQDAQRSYQANQAVLKAEERLGRYQKRVNAAFDEVTVMVILHEGSHQLFHAGGFHTTTASRFPWLVEGLATYCETPDLGGLNRMRLESLRDLMGKGGLQPLPELIALSSESKFIALGESTYAQAWSFVYFLMKRHREGFLRYLSSLNQTSKHPFAPSKTPAQWLEESFGKPLPELESEWRQFIEELI